MITQKKFEYFKSRCKYWLNYFGIKNWKVEYFIDNSKENDLAYVEYIYNNRLVIVYFCSINWDKNHPPTNNNLNRIAFHEVCEILYIPARYLAENRFLKKGEIDTEIHNLIRTLENVLLNK